MARSRNIKPALFKNELLGTADPYLTILFEGLWCLADREGRLEDRPLRINAEIFPYRGFTVDQITGYLTQLLSLGFISRYEADGVKVIQVIKFAQHQSPHNTEKESELPEPPLQTVANHDVSEITVNEPLSNDDLTDAKRSDSLLLIPDSPFLIPDSPLPESGDGTVAVFPALETADAEGRDYVRVSSPTKSMIPATEASAKLDLWLEEVAARIGAKSSATMANPKSWERMCMNAISEGRDLRDVLEVIEQEKERTRGQSQYFSADGVLKILQTREAKAKISKFIH